MVDTISPWGPEFEISFEVRITRNLNPCRDESQTLIRWHCYHSFLLFTTNGTHECAFFHGHNDGCRIPGIWFRQVTPHSSPQMHLSTTYRNKNGVVTNRNVDSEGLKLKTWYSFKIKQEVSDDGARLTVTMDGNKTYTLKEDLVVRKYENVKVFRSDPFYSSMSDFCDVRKLTYK